MTLEEKLKKLIGIDELKYYHTGLMKILDGLFIKKPVDEGNDKFLNGDGEWVTLSTDNIKFENGSESLEDFIADAVEAATTIKVPAVVRRAVKDFDLVSAKFCDELPTEAKEIKPNTIYFVKKADGEEDDVYEEYVYVDGRWEPIGGVGKLPEIGFADDEDIKNFFESAEEEEQP